MKGKACRVKMFAASPDSPDLVVINVDSIYLVIIIATSADFVIIIVTSIYLVIIIVTSLDFVVIIITSIYLVVIMSPPPTLSSSLSPSNHCHCNRDSLLQLATSDCHGPSLVCYRVVVP